MKTFLKAAEVWTPTARSQLTLDSAFYGSLYRFKSESKNLSFAYGEGLPGKVWEEGRPLAAPIANLPHFKRSDEASAAGLGYCLAVPIFAGEFLLSVLVLFCGSAPEEKGALEVWSNQSLSSEYDLSLTASAYNHIENFKWISQRLTLRKGQGLPGTAWARQKPVIMTELGESATFLRASHARQAGLTTGFAIPLETSSGDIQVITLLSSQEAPIASQCEIWSVDNSGQSMSYESGASEAYSNLASHYCDVNIRRDDRGAFGQVWHSGKAVLLKDPKYYGTISPAESPLLSPCGIYLPVIRSGKMTHIVVFYL